MIPLPENAGDEERRTGTYAKEMSKCMLSGTSNKQAYTGLPPRDGSFQGLHEAMTHCLVTAASLSIYKDAIFFQKLEKFENFFLFRKTKISFLPVSRGSEAQVLRVNLDVTGWCLCVGRNFQFDESKRTLRPTRVFSGRSLGTRARMSVERSSSTSRSRSFDLHGCSQAGEMKWEAVCVRD